MTRSLKSIASGVLTLLGITDRGLFVPYRYASSLKPPEGPYPAAEALMSARRADFLQVIDSFAEYAPALRERIMAGSVPWEDRGFFPKLDVVAAYALVRGRRPSRIVEIGSGASTHVLAAALADNGRGDLTCIDPQPRRSISDTGATVVQRTLVREDAARLNDFASDDILFIDSSHLVFAGSDVDIEFNHFFPRLPKGVLVHVHDIFLPDGYPAEWEERYFSEQNALMGWIVSGFFDIVYPSYYGATRLAEELKRTLGDLCPEDMARNGGSIWLRRVGDPIVSG